MAADDEGIDMAGSSVDRGWEPPWGISWGEALAKARARAGSIVELRYLIRYEKMGDDLILLDPRDTQGKIILLRNVSSSW